MTRLCDDGTVCTAVSSGVDRPASSGVCYLGGLTAVGSPCTHNTECAAGAICVQLSDGTQSCYRACTTAVTGQCDTSETCTPLVGMGMNGYCQPPAP